jgi:hypothetical protein
MPIQGDREIVDTFPKIKPAYSELGLARCADTKGHKKASSTAFAPHM